MIIRTLLLICFILETTTLYAQQIQYFDKTGNKTDQTKAFYFEKILTIDSHRFFNVRQNMNGDTLSTITCSSLDPIIRDGITKLYYKNGKLHYLKTYSDNKLNSTLKRFYESGQIMSIVEFSLDSVLNKCSFNEKGNEIEYINDSIAPKFMNNSIDSFRSYLLKNFYYPERAIKKHKTGKFKVGFTITESGQIDNITIIGEEIPEFKNEITRVIYSTNGKWIAGLSYGEPSRIKYSMTINFSF
jgi:antitoxin component YwqK of YwqJK toxin-antitoxin module